MALDKNIAPGTKIRVKSLKSNTAGIVPNASVRSPDLAVISIWDWNKPRVLKFFKDLYEIKIINYLYILGLYYQIILLVNLKSLNQLLGTPN